MTDRMTGAPGDRLTLNGGEISVELLPNLGARLHRLQFAGHDLLRTPADPSAHLREPFFWGAYVMAPWCNRVSTGPLLVGRRTIDLESNFADGSAIHGQVYVRPWEVTGDGLLQVRAGGDGWPWPYEVSLRLSVGGRTLVIDQHLVNLADDPMPAGIGLHPWFLRPVRVAVRADLVYPANTDSPAHPSPVDGQFDLRRQAEMADGLDATWSGLGDPPVVLLWPASGVRATIRADAPTLHITAASPAHLDAIAIEPQTHAPQGLRRLLNGEPGALALLAPGDELRQRVEMRFELDDSDRDDTG